MRLFLFAIVFSLFLVNGHAQGIFEIEMRYIEGGLFTMGCSYEQVGLCEEDEKPQFDTYVNSFFLSETEISQELWFTLMEQLPEEISVYQHLKPVGFINWYDAAVFCNRLSYHHSLAPVYYMDPDYNSILGFDGENWTKISEGSVYIAPNASGFRMPTEKEWEFAARGGLISQEYVFSGGADLNLILENRNSPERVNAGKSNELGLFGMSGNVGEWTGTKFQPYPLPLHDFNEISVDEGDGMVVRGGSFLEEDNALRVSARKSVNLSTTMENLGLRLARNAISVETIGNFEAIDCSSLNLVETPIEGNLFETTLPLPYVAGNGGVLPGQTVASQGVIGLSLSFEDATLEAGDGDILVVISGIPQSSGIAIFDFEVAGQSCRIEVTVQAREGEVSSLLCNSAELSESLVEGFAIENIPGSLSYLGGNGGPYTALNLFSSGVSGLNLFLPNGDFNIGDGQIDFFISGIPNGAGFATFLIEVGGTSCTLELEVEEDSSWPVDFVHCGGQKTEVVEVMNPITGRIWMDRNLGASRVATSRNDAQAYGDLYQWGRYADGHQCRNSPNTIELSTTDRPPHSSFIVAHLPPFDWRTPQNNSLWQSSQGPNNPCPPGFRVPTQFEMEQEILSWSSPNATGAFNSPLKFTVGGARDVFYGDLLFVGIRGAYWTSTRSFGEAINVNFSNSDLGMISNNRAAGFSIRCIKD